MAYVYLPSTSSPLPDFNLQVGHNLVERGVLISLVGRRLEKREVPLIAAPQQAALTDTRRVRSGGTYSSSEKSTLLSSGSWGLRVRVKSECPLEERLAILRLLQAGQK